MENLHCFSCGTTIIILNNFEVNTRLLKVNKKQTKNLKISGYRYVRCKYCNLLLGKTIDEQTYIIHMHKIMRSGNTYISL